jgi:predicted nicotinamide N-methyase
MTKDLAQDIAALAASLDRRFRTVVTAIQIRERTLKIVHPASAEDLIDESDFDRDERLPYWAELWPSSRVLAEWLLVDPGEGLDLLELGCGAGLVATCASLAGYAVTATDYYEEALQFAQVNAWRNLAAVPRVFELDWRALPKMRQSYDVIVASDVLYERPYGALVAQTIDAYLAPAGRALVADPGRVARDDFVAAVEALGLVVSDRTDVPFVMGPIHQTIAIFEIRRDHATLLRDPEHNSVLRP